MPTMPSKEQAVKKLLNEYQDLPEFRNVVVASVNQQGGWHSRPLHIAIYRESFEEVELLLHAGADPNAAGEYGERPLQVALNCGDGKTIEALLRAGASCELKDDKGFDAWSIAEITGTRALLDQLIVKNSTRQP